MIYNDLENDRETVRNQYTSTYPTARSAVAARRHGSWAPLSIVIAGFITACIGIGLSTSGCHSRDAAQESAAGVDDRTSTPSVESGDGPEAASGAHDDGHRPSVAVHAREAVARMAVGATSTLAGMRPHSHARILALLRAGRRDDTISALRFTLALTEAPTETDDGRAQVYLLGRLLADDDNPAAVVWLERLPTPFEQFDDRRLVWLARARLAADDLDGALGAIGAIEKHHDDVDEWPSLRLERARALHTLGRNEEAIEAALAIARDRRMPDAFQARGRRLAADWLRDTNPDQARRHERRLIVDHPAQPAAQEEGLSLGVDALSTRERFRRAERLMRRWAYSEAREEFRRFLDEDVDDGRYEAEAAWNIGVISLRKLRDDPAGAREMFERVIDLGGPQPERALYYVFRSHMRQEDYETALEVADDYLERYPNGTYVPHLSYYRGWLPYDRRDCETARPALRRHVDRHGFRRSITLGFWAWCFYREGDWEGAIDAFGELARRYHDAVERGKAWYWQARALHELGRDDESLAKIEALDERYPLTYYAVLGWQLRARIEGRDPRASEQPWPERGGHADDIVDWRDPEPWTWPALSDGSRSAQRYARVQRLVQLGEVDLARRAWNRVRSTVERTVPTERRRRFQLFMAHQIEDYHRAWKLGGADLTKRGSPIPPAGEPEAEDELADSEGTISSTTVDHQLDWALAYPRAYPALVGHLAGEYEIHPHFVYAIMRQESRYKPRAISSADAVGALQMIPSTARRVAADMGVEYDPRTFTRPGVGFRFSLFYMRRHLDVWRGQLVPTAASYNGGPAPIARWIRQNEGAPMDILIEEFAYNESRIYCRKVTEHMLRYLYLYEDDAAVRGRWLDAMFPVEFDYDIPDDVGY